MVIKPTVYDIAKEAGVSPATVSRVLTGNGPVKDKTRDRVTEVLKTYQFRPSSVARSLRARRSKTIGFILPDITNPYYSQLFLEVEVLAMEKGYSVMLCNSHSDYTRESQMLNVLLEKQVEAIVFTGGRVDHIMLTKKYIHELEKVNQIVPLITCSAMPGTKCIQIMNNERQGIFTLVGHLARLGHRAVGMVGGQLDTRQAFQRRQFFLEAAEEYNIEVERDWLIEGGFTTSAGRECTDKLLQLSKLPTAIIAFNDVVAIGAMGSLLRHGISIPHDMALTGFDGIQLTEDVTPAITTMVTAFSDYAKTITEIVLMMDGAGKTSETVFDMELAIRESTVTNSQ